jgi:predicted ATPase/DNA-binding XRE family transcriptional regulator
MAESFAALLRRHRVAAGLSQETLAERAGVSVDAISYLERDSRHAPQKATLDLLIAALALDEGSRHQIEDAAKLARARGPQAQRYGDNLPPELTSFVDREKEVAEIKELLQSHRFVTVVGTGGVGKSRGAIRVARGILDASGDGVWLAELAPISDPSLVTSVIARALSVQETPNRPMLDTLLAYLKRKSLLLILDNCEHVIDEARRVAAAILHGCPDVRILATSRESFGIAAEHVYHLPPLPVHGAVQLFSDRAVSADNRFILTVEVSPHVTDICRRLDGIPLAIELAAARVKVLSPRELAQKLDKQFRLFNTGDRGALPRHQTMRALIDWSYDLLSADERALFRKLSIFAGGFTLETAAAVCSDGEIDDILVLDLLSSLVDKSLIQAEAVTGGTRYRLLESTRQYAREKLRDAGEEDTVASAHACAFVTLAERLGNAYESTPERTWFAQVEAELENFQAARSWAFGTRGDVQLGQRLAGALRRAWHSFGTAEGQHWVRAAQQRVTTDTPAVILAALDLAEAKSSLDFNQVSASLHPAERALALYRELGDRRGIAEAQGLIGRAHIFLGNIAQGEKLSGQTLEALLALGARKTVLFVLESLAIARLLAGDLPGARQRFREALATGRAVGAERLVAIIATNLAEAEFRGGDAAAALRLADEALDVLRALGDTRHVANTGSNFAAYLVALRRYDEARAAARDAVTAARDTQSPELVACALQHLAAIAVLRESADEVITEDHSRAARILGYVDGCLAAVEILREYTEQQEYDAMVPVLRDALGADQLVRLMDEGGSWSEDQAVAEAMLI